MIDLDAIMEVNWPTVLVLLGMTGWFLAVILKPFNVQNDPDYKPRYHNIVNDPVFDRLNEQEEKREEEARSVSPDSIARARKRLIAWIVLT